MDDLINVIANQLNRLFPEMTIYDEAVPQNFKTPSFYIYQDRTVHKEQLMNNAIRTTSLGIVFSPDDSQSVNEQCRNVESIILREFRYLQDIKLNVFDLETQITDSILSIRFKVRYRTKLAIHEIKMSDIDTKGDVKHGEKES